jgi:hypothetical protein
MSKLLFHYLCAFLIIFTGDAIHLRVIKEILCASFVAETLTKCPFLPPFHIVTHIQGVHSISKLFDESKIANRSMPCTLNGVEWTCGSTYILYMDQPTGLPPNIPNFFSYTQLWDTKRSESGQFFSEKILSQFFITSKSLSLELSRQFETSRSKLRQN